MNQNKTNEDCKNFLIKNKEFNEVSKYLYKDNIKKVKKLIYKYYVLDNKINKRSLNQLAYYSCDNKNIELIKYLIEELNVKEDMRGCTLLIGAVRNSNIKLLNYLLSFKSHKEPYTATGSLRKGFSIAIQILNKKRD